MSWLVSQTINYLYLTIDLSATFQECCIFRNECELRIMLVEEVRMLCYMLAHMRLSGYY